MLRNEEEPWAVGLLKTIAKPLLEPLAKRMVIVDRKLSAIFISQGDSALLVYANDTITPVSADGDDDASILTRYKICLMAEMFRPENVDLLATLEQRLRARLVATG